MILYIGFAQREEWPGAAGWLARHASRFEEASGSRCLVAPHDMVTTQWIRRLEPEAVVLSGFGRSFQDFPSGAFDGVASWLLEDAETPVLAICGSHQLVGFVFGGDWSPGCVLHDQPMRKRRPGEPIVDGEYHPEYFMERGFYELEVHADDPLFAACARPPVVYESHYCEIKQLPEGFQLLASTPECRIQAMRAAGRPLVSVQFHPEEYTERFPDGRRFLEAFFREAREVPNRHARGAH